jgi:hypothetical protein
MNENRCSWLFCYRVVVRFAAGLAVRQGPSAPAVYQTNWPSASGRPTQTFVWMCGHPDDVLRMWFSQKTSKVTTLRTCPLRPCPAIRLRPVTQLRSNLGGSQRGQGKSHLPWPISQRPFDPHCSGTKVLRARRAGGRTDNPGWGRSTIVQGCFNLPTF